jgi:hypothetical protein
MVLFPVLDVHQAEVLSDESSQSRLAHTEWELMSGAPVHGPEFSAELRDRLRPVRDRATE